uniref:CalR9 n=2 Tax=Micromonospora TaxID=1873 RepID=Q8KNE1_MICEC|nr:CalR9 [Micromonospora echinospora]
MTGAAADAVVADYLALGLRMGRLVEGYVDCWFGDRALAERVAAEPAPDPAELAGQARDLLRRLGDADLDAERRRFLAAQLTAVECAARRAAGEQIGFLAEVETYFDVEVRLGDPDRYAAAHDAIDALLPGTGPLMDKVEAFYARNVVPPERLGHAVRAVADALRARARPMLGLPEAERVDIEVVRDRPWNAFNRYHGGFRSTVTLNETAGRTIAVLPLMATHEAYPGHHTEHCLKEAGLVLDRGWDEHRIALVNTPQCLVAEGTAEHAAAALLGPGWGRWTTEVLAGEGVPVEGDLVERMVGLVNELMPARQDAAILLHDRGASIDDAVEHLHRWLLLPRDRAEQIATFLTDPLWRAYSVTYIEGARLVGGWLAARPAGEPLVARYRTLLAEQLLPAQLRDGTVPAGAPPVPAAR